MHRARGESLYFWRLGFHPTYDKDQVVGPIHEVLHNHGVKSAACYEMFGPHDLLLRVWLPAGTEEDFRAELVDRLGHGHADMCDPFVVRRPLRHWLFPTNAVGTLPVPDADDIAALTSSDILDAEGSSVDDRRGLLSGRTLLADFLSAPDTTDSGNPGTKFAVIVTGDSNLKISQREHFEDTLTGILDNAGRIAQPSLYSGDGFGHFLILGLLRNQPVYVLTDELLNAIAKANIQRLYNARTYTHVSGQRDFVFIYESLVDVIPRTAPDPQPADPSGSARRNGGGFLPPATTGPPVVGKMFVDRFEVLSELGRGGFSTVYEVYDTVERDRRAVKAFHNADAFEHINREIRFLRKIEHPNVLRVYWADRTFDGMWYLVSELVEGVSLKEYVQGNRRLDRAEALRVVEELLVALSAIHPDERRIEALKAGEMTPEQFAELQELQDAGFVHRDVKPSNIVRTPRGIKLLDFNIASRAGDPIETLSGTPAYQAPDQSLGTWDVSTDLFASGVILFELLCDGEHPYPDRMPRCGVEPRRASDLNNELPPALTDFLRRACAPLAVDRFASAAEMRTALASACRLD